MSLHPSVSQSQFIYFYLIGMPFLIVIGIYVLEALEKTKPFSRFSPMYADQALLDASAQGTDYFIPNLPFTIDGVPDPSGLHRYSIAVPTFVVPSDTSRGF